MSDRAVVWVDGWQMACCGTPFSVGDSVDWAVSREIDRAFLGRATSPQAAERIDSREEHHDDEAPHSLTGTVRCIHLVSCRYALDDAGGSSPVAGSGRLRLVASTSERPPSADGEARPGWIFEVEGPGVR